MVKRKETHPQQSQHRGHDFVKQVEENTKFPLIYAGAILLFLIVLFHKFIFSNDMLYGSDTIQAGVFFRDFLVSYFKSHGAIPMWDPYIFCGLPFVDAFHGDIFYLPTFILKMIFPLYRALGWGLILHVYLAGIFAYMCARGFGLSRLASAFAGVSYMFSSYLVSLVAPGHDGKMFVTALFPLAFHFLNRGTVTYQLKYFILLGLTVALIILTPHPQMAYFTLWALGGFFLYRLIFLLKDKVPLYKGAIVSGLFFLAIVIGLLSSAIQFYPGYRYIKEFSPRAGEGSAGRSGYQWATSWSMHVEELVGQVVPMFSGVDDQTAREAGGGYWGRNSFKDNTEYSGFIALFLGAMTIALFRRRETWYLAGMALVALIYALGDTTPLFYLFYAIIPNVSKMRAPSMIMFLFAFSFSMLAAFGIDAISKVRSEAKTIQKEKFVKALLITMGILSVITLLFTVAGSSLMGVYTSIFYSSLSNDNAKTLAADLPMIKLSLWMITILGWIAVLLIRGLVTGSMGRIAIIGLIFVALIDLWRVDFRFIETVAYSNVFPYAPVLDRIKAEKEPVRVMDMTRPGKTFSSGDYFALNRVEQLVGYHGAQLKSFDEFIGGLSYSNLFNNKGIDLRPFNLTGTRYIILDRGGSFPDEFGMKKIYDNEVVVYQVPRSMRRASIYHAFELGHSDTTDITRLLSEDFLYMKALILYEAPEYQPILPDSGMAESVEIVEHEVNSQKYNVTMAAPGLLFVSDNYFPGWKVKVDGVEKKILLADHTFRAVSLEKGTHDVVFYYDWPRYNDSKLITLVTILLSLGGLGACVFFERKKRGNTP